MLFGDSNLETICPQAMKTCEKTNRWQCALALHQGALEASMIRIEVTEMLQRCSWIEFMSWSWMAMQLVNEYATRVKGCLLSTQCANMFVKICEAGLWTHFLRYFMVPPDQASFNLTRSPSTQPFALVRRLAGCRWDDMGRYGTILLKHMRNIQLSSILYL